MSHESSKAIEILEEAPKYDPQSAEIRINLAMIHLQQQFEKVLENLGAILVLNEQDQRAMGALAVCNFVLGRYERAVFYYRKLRQLQPGDKLIVLTLAVTLQLNGETEESEKGRQSESDFFRGNDHGRDAAIVHAADHWLVPGKRFWRSPDSPGVIS